MFPYDQSYQPPRQNIYSSRIVGPPTPSCCYPAPGPPYFVPQQQVSFHSDRNVYREWPSQPHYHDSYDHSMSTNSHMSTHPRPATHHNNDHTPPAPTQPTRRLSPKPTGSLPFHYQQRQKILFYHRDQPYYEFTNFALYPVRYDGKVYPTSEHLFQSLKVRFFHASWLAIIPNLSRSSRVRKTKLQNTFALCQRTLAMHSIPLGHTKTSFARTGGMSA
jgi:hypothetical protein